MSLKTTTLFGRRKANGEEAQSVLFFPHSIIVNNSTMSSNVSTNKTRQKPKTSMT